MTKIIIRTPGECDMVTSSPVVSTVLRLALEENRGNPIWYEPREHGEPAGPTRYGKLPEQNVLKRVTGAIRSAGKRHGRLPITVKCPRCGGTHIKGHCLGGGR